MCLASRHACGIKKLRSKSGQKVAIGASWAAGLLYIGTEFGQSDREDGLWVFLWGQVAWKQGTVGIRGKEMDGEEGGRKLSGTAGDCDEL